tara:strand:+ start:405 stop:617 length:213 start_codon:yes stop_codon:yes gene_type:complete
MIFKCIARYEVVKKNSNRFELRDLGKIEHTFYDLKSFDDAKTQFDIIVESFKTIFGEKLVSIQITDIHQD